MNDTILNNEILLNIGRFMNLHEEEDFILCEYVTSHIPYAEPIKCDMVNAVEPERDDEIDVDFETGSVYTTDTDMTTEDNYDSDDDIHIQINKYKMHINDINLDITCIETEIYESFFT